MSENIIFSIILTASLITMEIGMYVAGKTQLLWDFPFLLTVKIAASSLSQWSGFPSLKRTPLMSRLINCAKEVPAI